MSEEMAISARIYHVATGKTDQENLALLDQTGIGKVGGDPISSTTLALLDFTALTTPGQGWLVNHGTNDISIGPKITTTTEGTVFYPLWIAKPNTPTPIYFDPTTESTNPIWHKTASGTSLFEWSVREA